MITPLEQISAIYPSAQPIEPVKEQADLGKSVFGAIFQNAIQNVKDTDAVKNEAIYLLSTGQLDNPSAAVIAASKNELAVNLLIQLRNRAMDAYSELTRISM